VTIQREAQRLEGTAEVEFYTLDLTPIAPGLPDGLRVMRFTNQLNEKGEQILWSGIRWPAVPIKTDGWSLSGRGALPRPHVLVSNLGGSMSALCMAYEDLVGATFIRRRTFAQFLPPANFISGEGYEGEAQEMPRNAMKIRQKVADTPQSVEWELAWPGDVEGVELPRNSITADVCQWKYKSAECEWVPGDGPYFDVNDGETSDRASDECSLSLDGCRKRFVARFGRFVALPARLFPGARMPTA
jgi:lambda family phage minor tail protein L